MEGPPGYVSSDLKLPLPSCSLSCKKCLTPQWLPESGITNTGSTVDIFNPYHQGGQDFREPPSFPPGLAQGNEYIYRLAQQPKRAERSLDELERWWRTDNRAKGVSRAHMDLINQIGCVFSQAELPLLL